MFLTKVKQIHLALSIRSDKMLLVIYLEEFSLVIRIVSLNIMDSMSKKRHIYRKVFSHGIDVSLYFELSFLMKYPWLTETNKDKSCERKSRL